MQDEHGGLQNFLFEWLAWPRERVATFRGNPSEVYLENLAPLFYIDQDEGWIDIQALQITRYGQVEISEISVEYLLGALDALRVRVGRQEASQKSAALRDAARKLSEQITLAFLRHGWRIEWSGHGTIEDTVKRWSSRSLEEALKRDANVNLASEEATLKEKVDRLRKQLTSEPIDESDLSAPASASQRAINLKQQHHKLNEELHRLRIQRDEASELISNLEHRIEAATDLLRLKTTGVGRLDHIECPTCHRDLDPATFSLSVQSSESISTHIEALKRDRELMARNFNSTNANIEINASALVQVADDLRDAERALANVTNAIGTVRERFAQLASELNRAERALERIGEASRELEEFQLAVDRWLSDVTVLSQPAVATPDTKRRHSAFVNALRNYIVALGHSAVRHDNQNSLMLDEQFVPSLNNRRLRALGSASDRSRLVAAYSLALAAASREIGGLHPGLVILDEPLQQNPDPQHRELFIAFLSKQLAREAKFQTLIFTSLSQQEIERLRSSGINVMLPEGQHLLQLAQPNP